MAVLHHYDYNDVHQLSARSISSSITPNATQRTTLIIACCYIPIIGILWRMPYLNFIIYPFKLLTIGFHEVLFRLRHWIGSVSNLCVLTCGHIVFIELDPDRGGATGMTGGIFWLTFPAGYLGSSLIGAALITCGSDTNASKVASLVLAVFFVFTLWWARRNLLTWVLLLGMSGLIVLFWFLKGSEVLRFLVLFIGVMSCLYVLWDIIDDTFTRKVNVSDASGFAKFSCFPSIVWGVIWLVVALIFFTLGILVGIVVFKESTAQQEQDAKHFLPVPGSNGAIASSLSTPLALLLNTLSSTLLALL
ncbi:peptidase M50B-like-domain-containing protein [Russula ochroleuca]|uniref:Peptidase M50B-like-domain-containing protein n=1 Tax=Russula ochroleuca TaxID=152965 RepID=A0A9P5MVQ0_9AGAM|nr:peptidase M50B-like-domain-containing protein [Russula ochroleuca]